MVPGYLLCLVLMSCLSSRAQLNSGNLAQYLEKDGLPGRQVNQVLVDRLGYIWTGTINGLARFDGNEFKRFYFNPNDSATILGLICWSMLEDRKGKIWVSCSPSFLNMYDPASRSFRQLPFTHLIPHPANTEMNMRAMAMDNKGRIYFGIDTYYGEYISNGLLYKEENDDQLRVFQMPDSLPINNVYRITTDRSGNVMFLSNSGLFRIDENRKVSRFRDLDGFYTGESGPNDIALDGNGHLLVFSSDNTLVDYDLARKTYKKWSFSQMELGKPYNFANKLKLDRDGNIWLGISTGMYFFDRKTEQLSRFNSGVNKNLEKVAVFDFAIDSFGTVWTGTANHGLIKFENKTQLSSYIYRENDPNTFLQGWVSRLCQASDGRVWTISNGPGINTGGIAILDPATGSLKKIPYTSLPRRINGVAAFWEASPGIMRFSTNNDILDFNEKTLELKKLRLPGIPDSVLILHYLKDSHGTEWLSMAARGIYRREKNADTYTRIDLSKMEGGNSASNTVTGAYEGAKHGIWIIGDYGLFLYDYATGKITRHGYDKKKGDVFLNQDFNSIYEDRDGIVWVGNWQGGLSRYNVETGKIKIYTRDDGLPSMSIQGILPDEKHGALWLSTFEGLSRFDTRENTFNNFSLSDGIQSLLFADGSCLKTSTGELIFGGSDGITVIRPDEIKNKSVPPRVFLTDLKLFNKSVLPGARSILEKPIDETNGITLAYNQNNISIDYQALHFSDPSKNIYAYKLENYDNEWRNVGNLRTAYYPNLPPGHYIFHVKAANDKGVWNEQGASLIITVDPPWWRTNWAYVLYGLLFLILAFALDRYFRYRILEKEREKNRTRELEQAKEIQKAYHNLELAHESLKNTQKQLIQAEKMASLGELTAGIAHEIQNPLNFVNNFSEVNAELTEELNAAAEKGDLDEVRHLAGNIRSNEEKIRQHGKRADAIVKSMLQHSRTSTGQKEPTDVNALCSEYFNLAYHGMRARDKSFNTVIETDFEPGLPPVNIVPQDIGRVLLNLCNNAFYAVTEKTKSAGADYRPMVRLSTSAKKTQGYVTIIVEDNGPGIPKAVMEKIFQPFFTTKPTGQGTGLGLSLSYDIIKAHQGELKLESREGYGSSAIIRLPY